MAGIDLALQVKGIDHHIFSALAPFLRPCCYLPGFLTIEEILAFNEMQVIDRKSILINPANFFDLFREIVAYRDIIRLQAYPQSRTR
ncbi:MAG: hypothetical protein IKR13_05245 [Victivallales bacterium]|nr:hypothetical protein [Victivallales bacterium]